MEGVFDEDDAVIEEFEDLYSKAFLNAYSIALNELFEKTSGELEHIFLLQGYLSPLILDIQKSSKQRYFSHLVLLDAPDEAYAFLDVFNDLPILDVFQNESSFKSLLFKKGRNYRPSWPFWLRKNNNFTNCRTSR